jgi:hypothetical protein
MNTIPKVSVFGPSRLARFGRMTKVAVGVCGAALLMTLGSSEARALAFPGAVGFGSNTNGGNNGTVYTVTTLSDNGTGSFRTAVSSGNRTIKFSVSGYITLDSAVSVSSNITILGNTSTGEGIGVQGAEVSFYGSHDIICRYMRFRQGTEGSTTESAVNIGSTGGGGDPTATNIIFDHCSFEFGQWDTVDGVGCANVTVQYCIIADPINQQFGAHIEGGNVTWYRNLWVSGHNRQPLAKNNTQYINNVVYNYQAAYTDANGGGLWSHDIVNNYFITGPATTSAGDCFYQLDGNQSVYASGNMLDSNNDGTLNGSSVSPSGVKVLSSPWASTTNGLASESAASAYTDVTTNAGDSPHDSVDSLVISQVEKLGSGTTGYTSGTDGPGGGLYTSQDQDGLANDGYGTL